MSKRRDEIKNRAVLEFETCGCKHVIESNEVEARKLKLKIHKEQNCNFVFEGERLCYKVVIVNESPCTLCDIDFFDRLDHELKFDKDSFRVNGDRRHAHFDDHRLCYHINELKEDEAIVITFETEVE